MTVIALHLTQIACRSAWTILVSIIVFFLISFTWLGCIDSDGRGGAFLLFLSLVILTTFFLFLSSSFSRELQVRPRRNCRFQGPGLWFFHLRDLYQMGLGLGRRGVHQLIASVALLVKVSAGRGLYLGFGLGSNCLFDQSIPTI